MLKDYRNERKVIRCGDDVSRLFLMSIGLYVSVLRCSNGSSIKRPTEWR